MTHRVEIRLREHVKDPHAEAVLAQIRELGIDSVTGVRSARLFFLAGELGEQDVRRIGMDLLADPVTEEFRVGNGGGPDHRRDARATKVVEVHLKRGVMDPVAASAEQAVRDMGLAVEAVRTARRYELSGDVTDPQRADIARRLLANDCIEDIHFEAYTPPQARPAAYELKVVEIPIRDLDDAALADLSKRRDLFLNLTEMKAIRGHYRRAGREPRDVELEMIAQTWSEHCVHKTFRSDVRYEGLPIPGWPEQRWSIDSPEDLDRYGEAIWQKLLACGAKPKSRGKALEGIAKIARKHLAAGAAEAVVQGGGDGGIWVLVNGEKAYGFGAKWVETGRSIVRLALPNLMKSTVFAATRELARPWCLSVFEDNAGVIEFDDDWAVCFKVETHNHPSALDPYGGAGTGIGGVIRDPMGTGLGAFPVANTDVFCFGPPQMPLEDVPKGVLHPRRIMRGVVAGVRDYGNRMGIPTLNGAVYFDEKYVGNPLVYCGTVGLMPTGKCRRRRPAPGDAIVVVGGRTGRDGIHGATFSSGELTHEHETEFSGAVQIGNAITEKKMLDTIVQAREAGLYSAITDCGAGGLSSAVGEMGSDLGAEVHLERVPLKYAGLSYWEIWESEAQERMTLAVPPGNVEKILKVFKAEGVEATVIGHFGTEDRALRLFYAGQLVGELDMEFLHEGLPRPTKQAVWDRPDRPSPLPPQRSDYGETLWKLLASPNVASKEWIIRQYDHEVQGGSVVKPLVGAAHDGPGDAAVIRPVLTSRRGLVIACGMNPKLGDLDPYQSALHAIDEALRNCVAVGGNLARTALLDNFSWGNCNKPDRMGSFVHAAKACYDGALAYGTPFVSGKDSLNNEFQTDSGETIAIPATLLISAISVIEDVSVCVTADAKAAGNCLFLLGATTAELGGSHLLLVEGLESGTDVPAVDLAASKAVLLAAQSAIAAGLVRACHDLSEGGLAVAAAEMAFAGGLGVEIDLSAVPCGSTGVSPVALLFAENAGRFLVEVAPDRRDAFLAMVKDVPFGELGRVTDTGRIVVHHEGRAVIDLATAEAKAAWQGTFDW